MEITSRVQRTLDFLREAFDRSDYFQDHPADRAYRWEHSLRVAGIGAHIAKAEGMDVEAMTVACLLHDIAYANTWPEDYDWANHGRDGARMARDFVESLGFSPETTGDILYGIAIHVDDKADFAGERTPFALTVGDADNVDRFDAFRIYERLERKGFYDLPLADRLSWLAGTLTALDRCLAAPMTTAAAQKLWGDRLVFQRTFYTRLLAQTKAGAWDKEEGL